MPPHADPALEKRILDAARRLWRRGGEKALTMRAVAAAARTTTPTVYGRFRNKRDIMRELRLLIRQELFEMLYKTETPREVCERYISFAFAHPFDYRLLTESWTLTHSGVEPRPTSELMKQRLADMFGGEPSEYARLTMALWAMLHGMVMLAISGRADKVLQEEMREAFMEAFDTLSVAVQTSRAGKHGAQCVVD
jgi:AcrR family transcriptional regulator